ncbi:TetR/AcrR family transcriptional regulator C-terminal domain-containing protein [Streptomyces sp. TG1A-8]|uniref:TetR/AcrR family transcriptional regulator n=1 Tax=Streptomyces sp. TG1A-8 TaxID=3051385 RepID=UPI00265C2485|nr:TetR/AcrR family transcriptional regulator C-terminal domain-containing protein [Streptomyces sp. TG1A-8]MDO0926964.1 TetR/AcrR family transcriptional regulator C-terminal domain-containing protein [Streptomyces sp. TG1A-8]
MAKAAARSAWTSVWLAERAPRRGGRGGQPSGLDRERITGASVRLLDAEGLAKFSMRRLAGELDVTAMSLYWYVDTKDDLLELALDAAFGELRLPDPQDEGADWREQLRELATAYRALLVRHPWMSPLAGRYLNIGPHFLAFSRVVQRVVRRAGLPAHGVTGAISAVFQFVYGYGTVEGHFLARTADTGLTPDEYVEQAMGKVADDPGTADAVHESRDLRAARGGADVADMMDRDFTFALDLLIAGIEAMVARG